MNCKIGYTLLCVGLFSILVNVNCVKLINWQTSLCLEGKKAWSGGGGSVSINACHGKQSQEWTRKTDGTIENMATITKHSPTGQCLETDKSGKVYTSKCSGSNFQKWTQGVELKNSGSGMCLESDKSKVYTKKCNKLYPQTWRPNKL